MHEWIPIIGGFVATLAAGIIFLFLNRWDRREEERRKRLDKMLAEWEERERHKTHSAGK